MVESMRLVYSDQCVTEYTVVLPISSPARDLFQIHSVPLSSTTSQSCFTPYLGNDLQLTSQPAQALEDEHPQISSYLYSLDPSAPQPQTTTEEEEGPISALAVDNYTSTQTTNLLEETKRIMEESERDGTDPDERLREVVERAVREGFNFGGALGGVAEIAESIEVDEGRKRTREDGP